MQQVSNKKEKKVMIEVIKIGSIIPVKIFDDWWKMGKWCDEFIRKDKGCDPTLYKINTVSGFKKLLYTLIIKIYNFATEH